MEALRSANNKLQNSCYGLRHIDYTEKSTNLVMKDIWISNQELQLQVELYTKHLLTCLDKAIDETDINSDYEDDELRRLEEKLQSLEQQVGETKTEGVELKDKVLLLKQSLQEKELNYKDAMLSKLQRSHQPVERLSCIKNEINRIERQLFLLDESDAKPVPKDMSATAAASTEILNALAAVEGLTTHKKKLLNEVSSLEAEYHNRLENVARSCAVAFDPSNGPSTVARWSQHVTEICTKYELSCEESLDKANQTFYIACPEEKQTDIKHLGLF